MLQLGWRLVALLCYAIQRCRLFVDILFRLRQVIENPLNVFKRIFHFSKLIHDLRTILTFRCLKIIWILVQSKLRGRDRVRLRLLLSELDRFVIIPRLLWRLVWPDLFYNDFLKRNLIIWELICLLQLDEQPVLPRLRFDKRLMVEKLLRMDFRKISEKRRVLRWCLFLNP